MIDLNADEVRKVLPEGLELKYTDEGLVLTDGRLSMTGDFSGMLPRLKQSNLEHEILVKAVRIKGAAQPITVMDATAGMGEDSLLIAASGCNVLLYEYDPVIALLLSDSINRALEDERLAGVVNRMDFHFGSSIEAMRAGTHPDVDVIYLDPMFPERQKSGLIKKKFQLLQQLESPCSDENELLDAAMNAGAKKIVIKRPLKGPFLAGVKPDYSLKGKAIRYDCILIH